LVCFLGFNFCNFSDDSPLTSSGGKILEDVSSYPFNSEYFQYLLANTQF
jgi:hypothetical protein